MSDMVVSVQGFTMQMGDFKKQYGKVFAYMKQNINTVAQRFLNRWATNAMVVARHLAPSSFLTDNGKVHITEKGSSLANSIVIAKGTNAGSVKTASVGVDSSLWHSAYPEWFRKKYKKNPPWGVNSKNLALFIHEYWDKFTANKPMARERAAVKQSMRGGEMLIDFKHYKGDAHVGEKFLYRAAKGVSSPRGLAVMASAEMNAEFMTYGKQFTVGKYKHLLSAPTPTFSFTTKRPDVNTGFEY